MEKLIVALPKGRLFDQTVNLFKLSGILDEEVKPESRKLVVESKDFKFLLVRAKDVPTYVEYGVADIGVAGDDVLLETNPDVYKPVDLKIGACRIVVAGLPESKEIYNSNPSHLKIATKYPKIAESFFKEKGINTTIIELYGSIELAPILGLSQFIVDIVETGTTLRENGLVVIDNIRHSSAKLIINRISYKTKNEKILQIIQKLRQVVG
ncbi:MAG: ATP phosphoribosyltransferase [Hydrogenothermus sp.]|nr:MAG: ATP phosphoribosyltransferase [Hydrogenothermus sp.]